MSSKVKVFGILNVTPDSFSDGGAYLTPEDAEQHAHSLVIDGADVIDVGAEATGRGSKPISLEEEMARLKPVVDALAGAVSLSIDTYKAKVAAYCLERGAQFINDVSALRADPEMIAVLRDLRAPVILMHAKDGPLPHASELPRDYKNVVLEIRDFLARRIDFALDSGLNESQLIVDPGMGRFVSQDDKYSWEILERFGEFAALGFPLMIGTSRKGFLGGEVSERDKASAETSVKAVKQGATYVRTHNPKLLRESL